MYTGEVRTLITAPMEEEAAMARASILELPNAQTEGTYSPIPDTHIELFSFSHSAGTNSRQHLALSTVGVGGKAKPAVVSTIAAYSFKDSLQSCIVIGIGASTVPQIVPGDVVLPERLQALTKFLVANAEIPEHNQSRLTGQAAFGELHPMRVDSIATALTEEMRARAALAEPRDFNLHIGGSAVTFPGFIFSPEFVAWVNTLEGKPVVIDMETHNIAEAVQRVVPNLKVLAVRGISDTAGVSGVGDEVLRNKERALRNTSHVLKHLLVQILGSKL